MSQGSSALSADVLRQAYGMFPSGVTAVCALIGGQPVGMAASSFTSVSLDPPLVSLCMAHTSSTWPRLHEAPVVGVSVMAAEHGDVARALSTSGGDRFANASWEVNDHDAVFLQGAPLWLECSIWAEMRAGDHDIAVFRVNSVVSYPAVAPLVFHASTFRSLADVDVRSNS